MRIVLSLFAQLVILAPTIAQTGDSNILCGTVRDEVGGSLPGVQLKAKKKGSSKTYPGSANGEGKFNLNVPQGIFQITFWLEGFKRRTLRNISSLSPCFDVELRSAVKPHNIT